jgi:hypothetical protein
MERLYKIKFLKEKPLCVAIGKGVKEVIYMKDTFLVGNCTSKCKE